MVLDEEDKKVLAKINRELKQYAENLERIRFFLFLNLNFKLKLIRFLVRLRDGIKNILNISRVGNQYLQARQPWVLLKGTEEEK